jgi:hypothetical protein
MFTSNIAEEKNRISAENPSPIYNGPVYNYNKVYNIKVELHIS